MQKHRKRCATLAHKEMGYTPTKIAQNTPSILGAGKDAEHQELLHGAGGQVRAMATGEQADRILSG